MKVITLLIATLFLLSCRNNKNETPDYTVFTNFTLIDGSGAEPIADAVLVIKNHDIVAVGPKGATTIPDNSKVIDLKGKFIIPGLVNSHGHVDEPNDLDVYARYGVTSVVSLGGEPEALEQLRDVIDTANVTHARLYIAGAVITGKTPAEAAAVADSNKVMGVDWMKIRVDDNLGTAPKMTEEVYKAVIDRSHDLGYKIATHMYYLEDAKKLLATGADFMAHSVRDKPVDEQFINLIKQKKVCYCPTLTREYSTFVYGSTPGFFNDPFFKKEYDSTVVQPLKDPARQEQVRNSKSAQTYEQQLPVAVANLKTLSDEGVPIAFGTDSGVPNRFIGYFEHLELMLMFEAGMSPMKIIQSATKDAAECMGLKKIGWLTPGYKADFIVLGKDPSADIKSTMGLESVYIGGQMVNR